MKKRYGYAGEILRVNLSSGEIWMEPTENYADMFLGGRCINTRILLNELDPKTDWSDPENMIAFGAGMLEGTLVPGACRVSIDSKNVFNNGMGSANSGGFVGPELRFAGFDNVVISGRAEKPVYLWISDGKAEIRDASFLWGKTTWETEKSIRKEHGDERIRVAAIGPAAEKLVKATTVMSDRSHSAGGSGVATVMGSKNLKALAVRGTRSIDIADPERFMKTVDVILKRINQAPYTKGIREKGVYGGQGGVEGDAGWLYGYRPVRNGQDEYWDPEKVAKIGSKLYIQNHLRRNFGCFSCPLSCEPWLVVENEPFKIKGEGYWNNSANAFCTKIDNTNLEAAIYAHLLSNQLGLDIDNAATVSAWAYETYEKGLITKEDTDGLELTWGNYDSMISMLKKLANRDGFGDFLADGVVRAAEKLGKESEKFATHIKGQDSLDGIRINKQWGFAIVTSPVSGRHLRGAIYRGYADEKFDTPVDSYENVPRDTYIKQQEKAIMDSTGVCVMTYLTIDDLASLVSAATGKELSKDDLMLIGLREHNLEKAFNTLHAGFTREDDHPSYRYWNEPIKSGPFKGDGLDHEIWEKMLDEHYELHNWDVETSWQTRGCLEKLGLEDVAERLEKAGRLK